jgi:hypothetical protein
MPLRCVERLAGMKANGFVASVSRLRRQFEATLSQCPATVTVAASYGLTIGLGWLATVDSETTETRRGRT